MFNLGFLYASGQGVAQDSSKAHEWYQKAADQGRPGPLLPYPVTTVRCTPDSW
jgi:TPR repeat protein